MIKKQYLVLLLCCIACTFNACKLAVRVNSGGSVESSSRSRDCPENTLCTFDITERNFSESFTAVPLEGYEFVHWQGGTGFLCGDSTNRTCLLQLPSHAISDSIVASAQLVYILPIFRDTNSDKANEAVDVEPFPYKNSDDPIFIVVTGQSNAVQIFLSRVPMERNPLVWDWATDDTLVGTNASPRQWSWHIPDPNGALTTDIGTGIVSGYPQGMRGGTAWGLADQLAKMTGRRVFMVCTAQGGQPISQWQPGVGAVGLELDMQVSDALAALQIDYPQVKFADIVVWIQGERDAQKNTPPDLYADHWILWRDYVEGANNPNPWVDSQRTRWYLVQMSQESRRQAAWPGQKYTLEKAGGRTVLIPSSGKETIEGIHYWGDQATLFGEEIAADVVSTTGH